VSFSVPAESDTSAELMKFAPELLHVRLLDGQIELWLVFDIICDGLHFIFKKGTSLFSVKWNLKVKPHDNLTVSWELRVEKCKTGLWTLHKPWERFLKIRIRITWDGSLYPYFRPATFFSRLFPKSWMHTACIQKLSLKTSRQDFWNFVMSQQSSHRFQPCPKPHPPGPTIQLCRNWFLWVFPWNLLYFYWITQKTVSQSEQRLRVSLPIGWHEYRVNAWKCFGCKCRFYHRPSEGHLFWWRTYLSIYCL